MKRMRLLFVLATFCLLVSKLDASAHDEATLIRDAWGTPHIFAETDAGAFYGLGYACAQDRLFQMTINLRVIQGRLAETLGDIPLRDGRETALELDRKMRLMGLDRKSVV